MQSNNRLKALKKIYHFLVSFATQVLFNFPSRKLHCIGVTGTDGKTTTTKLIYEILKADGRKVAMISTVGAYIGDKVYDVGFHVTTPSSFALQKYIKKVVDCGNDYLILEVTSHSLDQYRVWGVSFDIGVLTNITHEHLDYHLNYGNYLKTKLKLLKSTPCAVLNRDDESFYQLFKSLKGKTALLTYSLSNDKADFTPHKFPFSTPLVGNFNEQNCLAAIATAKNLGVSDKVIRKTLQNFEPPCGRQTIIYDKEFKVIIDFAHTPNAFTKILPAVKPKKGRLIHVFGSAGQRDATKRPLMGKASSQTAQIIILTAEDPRSEKIEDINKQIASGISKKFKKGNLFFIPDRRQAINFAIKLARKDDTVIATGKGHEKSMNYGQAEEPWDEFAAAREALKQRVKTS